MYARAEPSGLPKKIFPVRKISFILEATDETSTQTVTTFVLAHLICDAFEQKRKFWSMYDHYLLCILTHQPAVLLAAFICIKIK